MKNLQMRPKKPPFHKTLSGALACSGDNAEQLGLRTLARTLHEWSFRVAYQEWRHTLATPAPSTGNEE